MKKLTIREGWIIVLCLFICIGSFATIAYDKHQYNKLEEQYNSISTQLEQLKQDNIDCQDHSVVLLNQYNSCKNDLEALKKN